MNEPSADDLTTDAVDSYRRSFHYKAIRFGETNTAVCQDCHTVHDVLPKDSAHSSIADANLPKTCGQSDCHPGAQMNFSMSGANHLDLRIDRRVHEEYSGIRRANRIVQQRELGQRARQGRCLRRRPDHHQPRRSARRAAARRSLAPLAHRVPGARGARFDDRPRRHC